MSVSPAHFPWNGKRKPATYAKAVSTLAQFGFRVLDVCLALSFGPSCTAGSSDRAMSIILAKLGECKLYRCRGFTNEPAVQAVPCGRKIAAARVAVGMTGVWPFCKSASRRL